MIRLLILEDNSEVRYRIYNYLKQDYEIFVTKIKMKYLKFLVRQI